MQRIGWLLLIGCTAVSALWGLSIGRSVSGGVLDFQAVYYGSRCLLHHSDPYNESEFIRRYLNEGRQLPSDSIKRKALTLYVNLPTTLLLIAPFALLPWGIAQALWIALLVSGIVLAAFLVWRIGAARAPAVSAVLLCLLLLNCEVLFATGNTAGIVVSLSVIAVWCFLNERCIPFGILCFSAALAIKPHDSGILWFYFLLVGGTHRKRALQALGITCAIVLAAILWLSNTAPNWLAEMRSNLAAISMPGGLHEPGLTSMTGRTPAMVIDLQAITSSLWPDPRIYNLASYLICGFVLLVWAIIALRSRFSASNAWFAIASASALTLLATYHRPYDAKLLLLTVPACAMLWADGGALKWPALVLTASGILFTGDIFLAVLAQSAKGLDLSGAHSAHKMLIGILYQPAPLALLTTGVFYLWVYYKFTSQDRIA